MDLNPHDVAVGARLSLLRKVVQLSQVQFAAALRVSQPALINYMQGRRPLPSESLLHIYKTFGTDPLWVLQGPEPDPRPYEPDVDVRALVEWGKKIDRALKSAGRECTSELRDRLVGFCYAQKRKKPNATMSEVLEMAMDFAA